MQSRTKRKGGTARGGPSSARSIIPRAPRRVARSLPAAGAARSPSVPPQGRGTEGAGGDINSAVRLCLPAPQFFAVLVRTRAASETGPGAPPGLIERAITQVAEATAKTPLLLLRMAATRCRLRMLRGSVSGVWRSS